jgi:hypothetical protein
VRGHRRLLRCGGGRVGGRLDNGWRPKHWHPSCPPSAASVPPCILALGIDEDTATEVAPGRRFRVLGQGAVYVLDASGVVRSNVASEARDRAVSVYGIRLHVPSQSDELDLTTRTPKPRPAETVDEALRAHPNGNGRASGKAKRRAARRR